MTIFNQGGPLSENKQEDCMTLINSYVLDNICTCKLCNTVRRGRG